MCILTYLIYEYLLTVPRYTIQVWKVVCVGCFYLIGNTENINTDKKQLYVQQYQYLMVNINEHYLLRKKLTLKKRLPNIG